MSPSFKTDTVHGAIDFGNSEDLFDLICDGGPKRDVNSFATERARLLETILVQIADNNNGSTKELTCRGTCQANRPSTRDIDSRSGTDACCNRTVIACG